MRTYLLLSILLLHRLATLAQEVPHKILFADMELKLTREAIADIQADVDALTRSETYFQKKLERVDMYMPIIERIFKEEGLPDDFKYLVIQESALISDAVSSSNAVGFWQFKEISALENDLRIDGRVDERKNIVSATRAAAKYLKNHNNTFDNWAHALIAYQRGMVGAKSVINDRYAGAKKMPITKNTYWYLKKYLAHKIAFENAIGTSRPTYFLVEKQGLQGKSLKSIADEYNIALDLLEEYNKWLSKGQVPEDKDYTVIIPLTERPIDNSNSINKKTPQANLPAYDLSATENQPIQIEGGVFSNNALIAHEVKVNKLKAIVAAKGYTVKTLAEKGGLSEKKFRRFNDMSMNQPLEIGSIYYLERKLNRAKYYYHTVYPKETMWEISQKYGLKLHKLYRKNRMKDPTKPETGRVLWLRLNRPYSVPAEYKELNIKSQQELDEENLDESIAIDALIEEDVNTIEKADTLPKETQEPLPTKDTAKAISNKENIKAEDINNRPLLEASPIAVEQITQDSIDIVSILKKDSVQSAAADKSMEQEELPKTTLQEYTIKKGDTFFSIANRFNMPISALLKENNLSIQEPLKIGQIILVDNINEPSHETEEDKASLTIKPETGSSTIKHTISAGETLYSIARTYKVSLNDIMKWNNKEDYSIKEGEVILIEQK